MTDTAAVTLAAPATRFPLTTDALSGVAGEVLRAARAGGATAAETEVSQAFGLSVTVRKADVETIAYIRDKGLAGAMFWEYSGDRTGVLLDTLFTSLRAPR